MGNRGKNNRRKGHELERYWARQFRPFFPYCRTTRQESTLLDSCGIDLTNIPFFVQCKAGYEKSYPKYDQEYDYIKYKLGENFPEDHPNFEVPIILIHKLDGSGIKHPQKHYVSTDYLTFQNIINSYYQMSALLQEHGIEYHAPYLTPM